MEFGTKLARVLGFWALVVYGVGDILGAGIYALIGKIAGVAGFHSWVSFGISLVAAALTAMSYAELGSRFPRSAGAAAFCQAGFRFEDLSLFIGWLVLCSGMVSMATVSKAFAGYVNGLWPALPAPLLIVCFLLVLTAVNFSGMKISSGANLLCTAVELSGLLLVIGSAALFLARGGAVAAVPSAGPVSWGPVFQAGALAFFAFIGFEDMVNVSEEVIAPEEAMPKAILTAVAISGCLYILIAFLAVRVVPPAELAASGAPLLEVVRTAAPAVPAGLFTLVAVFAVSNTALLNFIMGSRLIYGMAQEKLLPAWLGAVHPRRRTPHIAILVILAAVIGMALSGTLVHLAGTTSTLILGVFFVVNGSLLLVKRRHSGFQGFQVPMAVPAMGAVTSLGLMAFLPRVSLKGTLLLIGAGLAIVLIRRFRG
ncbi:MAG: amino acid permease [Candidatus Omnitrophica bacterium]|nr:amino acid permease [Candidatus Omnitrophota bacterium]